jgi:hypothetical protein
MAFGFNRKRVIPSLTLLDGINGAKKAFNLNLPFTFPYFCDLLTVLSIEGYVTGKAGDQGVQEFWGQGRTAV